MLLHPVAGPACSGEGGAPGHLPTRVLRSQLPHRTFLFRPLDPEALWEGVSWGGRLDGCRRKFWGESAKSLFKKPLSLPPPGGAATKLPEISKRYLSPRGRGRVASPCRPPPAPRAQRATLTKTRLNLSSSSPAAGIGCLGTAGCLGDSAAGLAGCSALPAALPMVVPTQSARRLQPRKSSFPGEGG